MKCRRRMPDTLLPGTKGRRKKGGVCVGVLQEIEETVLATRATVPKHKIHGIIILQKGRPICCAKCS